MGEEDLMNRSTHSCWLTCLSTKGSVYQISVDHFNELRDSEYCWKQIKQHANSKEIRRHQTYIKGKPRNFISEERLLPLSPTIERLPHRFEH